MSKVHENRVRRMAERQGYRLVKSRSRDALAMDFGLYALIDADTGGTVNEWLANHWICSWDLQDCENWLLGKLPLRTPADRKAAARQH